jgi:asparagine synthase (glutamine-hydrolysing)
MCGILIAYGARPVDRARFDAARDTLVHRGPDAQRSVFLENDCLALGHTRLSIIDLSSRAHQPMRSDDLWVTFNGEIYNYRELRIQLEAEGCRFMTSSDTEVLLHGYRVWGEDLCSRLHGMFAFVIWDGRGKRAFLGRDHLGQKPLYYTEAGGEFVAASEIKAIKAYSRHSFRMRKESVIDALVQDFVAEPETWYQDIKVLPAGHQMTLRRTARESLATSICKYWSFEPPLDPQPVSEMEALERLEAEVNQAVRSHLIADVEVGAFLSGGIDSTCVVTEAARLMETPIRTFSIGFGSNDELPRARSTARAVGATHTEAVVSEADFAQSADNALSLFDSPFADTSLVATERVSELARRDVKVVVTGDGGDECFGGYDYGKYLAPGLAGRPPVAATRSAIRATLQWFWDQLLWQTVGAERWSTIARERLVNMRKVPRSRRGFLSPELIRACVDYDPSAIYQSHRDLRRLPFRDAQWVGIKVQLPSRMLAKVDRCSMAHSLEARAPFLAPKLIEAMLSFPLSISNPAEDWYKGLLRRWLHSRISQEVLDAKKRGFALPRSWAAVPLPSGKTSSELFPACVEASLIRPGGWRQVSRSPRILWYFQQINRALDSGILRV